MAEVVDIFCSVSSKEIGKVRSWLIPSLCKQRQISRISLHLINYTGVGMVYDGPAQVGKVAIRELSKGTPCGFGEAHNFAFEKMVPADYFLIINPDVYCHHDCVSELVRRIESNTSAGLVEARQLPFEHPKEYEDSTGHTPWASGSCVFVKSSFFREVKGFDENFWMYCEDVDLSWRAWLNKYEVIHCRDAVAYHFTGAHYQYRDDRFYLEQFWCARNFIYLMYKFWGAEGEKKATRMLKETWYPEDFKAEAIKSFQQIKSKMTHQDCLLNMTARMLHANKIKVLGYNIYHVER